MKRISMAISLLVIMSMPLAQAQPGVSFGVGASGGVTYPILQDDQNSGSIFAIRGRWSLGGFGVLEPTVEFTKYGAPDPLEIDGQQSLDLGIDGSEISMYGVNLVIGGAPGGKGLKSMIIGGLGFYKTSNDDTENLQESKTKLGFSGGLGLGVGIAPTFDLEARGLLHVIKSDGGASKKSATVLFGVNFYFGVI